MKKFIIFVIALVTVIGMMYAYNYTNTSKATTGSNFVKEDFVVQRDSWYVYYTISTYNDLCLFETVNEEMYLEYLSTLDESQILSINIARTPGGTRYFITYKSLDNTNTLEE